MKRMNVIPNDKAALDSYEVDNLFPTWSFLPAQSPLRVVAAKGVRFTTEDGRERLDFSSCFVSHNIGHQDLRVIEAITRQLNQLASFAPTFSTEPRALLAKLLEEEEPQ